MGFRRALVHQHKADDRVVRRGRRHARVHPHVVILGDVVVAHVAIGARRGLHHVLLAQPAVQPAVLVLARPVVLLDEQLGRIGAVDPLGHIVDGQVRALARGGVHHDHTLDGGAAEQADSTRLHRADPPRLTVLVDLERLLVEHVEGVLQLHVAVDIAGQRLGTRIEDRTVAQLHDLRILRGHVHQRVCRDALGAIRQPLEQIGIAQRAHAHGRALVVDLAIRARDLELADVLGDVAHGAITQQRRRIAVDDGDLGIVDLLDILREVGVLRFQHASVLGSVAGEHRQRCHGTQHADQRDGHGNPRRHLKRLRLRAVGVDLAVARFVRARLHIPQQEQRQQDEHHHEHPGVHAVDVDRRMEPPVGRRHDKQHQHRGDDERLLAHLAHFVAERELGSAPAVTALVAAAAAKRGERVFGTLATGTASRRAAGTPFAGGATCGSPETCAHIEARLLQGIDERLKTGCLFHGIPFSIDG